MTPRIRHLALGAWLALLLLPAAAWAVDGTRLIDQARALAGGLTPGDAPGFPVTISQSGSYRLSGNLTVPDAGTTAIEITADNVTLDLNGFAIVGPTVCSGFPNVCAPVGAGIGIWSERNYIAVRNGAVRGMGGDGMRLNRPAGAGATSGHLVDSVQVASNGGDGIMIGNGLVRASISRRNGARGIALESGSALDNDAQLNGDVGVRVFGMATVRGNNVVSNHGCGISVNSGLVSDNMVGQNQNGLCLGSVGYRGNTLIVNGALGGLNMGQNMCVAAPGGVPAVCP